MIWLTLLGGLVLIALTGVPVGVGLGLIGLFVLQFFVGGATFLAVNTIWNSFSNFVFSAVPLFIIMGEILLASGVSRRLYVAAAPFFRRVPGGLLHTNIVACTLFGAVSGTSTSTAAGIGSVAYPELRARGYDRPTIVGTLAAGGTLGLLIPPSLTLLLYGATQGVSIGKLFVAGLIPGLLLSVAFMVVIWLKIRANPALAKTDEDIIPVRRMLLEAASIWPVAGIILAVLGSIYLGIATATEAAALGVISSIAVGFWWGDLTVRKLTLALRDGMVVFATLGMVMIGALILAQSISVIGLPTRIMQLVGGLELGPYGVLFLVVIFYLVLGCFFDGVSLLLMTLPVVFPVMTGLGFDPVWLGVIITILIEIGMLTPPVGMNLFVLVAIARGEVGLMEAAKAAAPFWIVLLLSIVVFCFLPSLILFLPSLV